ncbi:MAG: HlyD family efflux transporter periplasmic adaptor subunit [Pirellulales bacterium]|nr:HlyD family efflux transporter periplasmic adaptor subunit [Pirellulales bacterium]
MKFSSILTAFWLLSAAVLPGSAQTAPPDSDTTTKPSTLYLEQEVDVASQEEGILENLPVEAGMEVSAKQLLAQIDDTIPRMQCLVAKNKLDVAIKEAENTIPEDYARASLKVAEAEVQRARIANQQMPGVVSETDMRQLLLKVTEMMLSVKKAQMDQTIARLQCNVSQAELDATEENLKRRKIFSPADGIVVDVRKHVGEWVQKGDQILRLVRVNPLRAEVELDISEVAPNDVAGRKVTFAVELTGGRTVTFPGEVTFINPQLSRGKYVVRAKIQNRQENGQWLLQAGRKGELTIHLK